MLEVDELGPDGEITVFRDGNEGPASFSTSIGVGGVVSCCPCGLGALVGLESRLDVEEDLTVGGVLGQLGGNKLLLANLTRPWEFLSKVPDPANPFCLRLFWFFENERV